MNYQSGKMYKGDSMYEKHRMLQDKRKSDKNRILIILGFLMVATIISGLAYFLYDMNRYHISELVVGDDIRTRFDMKPINGYVYDDNGDWGEYIDGKPSGKIVKYNEFGNIIYEQIFSQGEPNGIKKQWCSNGQLSHKSLYNKGDKNGLSQSWFCDGMKMDSVNYINNMKEGVEKVWYNSGILKSKKRFLGNVLKERWEWSENSDPLFIPYDEKKVIKYLQDTLISKHPLEGLYTTSVYKLGIININEYDQLLVVNIKDTKNQGNESQWFSIGEIKGWINPRFSTDNRLELRWINADKTISSYNARFYPQSRNLYVVLNDRNTERTSDDITMILEFQEIY